MPNRTVVTAALAAATTIATATVAVATTLVGPVGSVGTDAAVSVAAPAPAPAGGSEWGSRFDPRAVALLASASRTTGAVEGTSAAPGRLALPFALGRGGEPGSATPAGASGRHDPTPEGDDPAPVLDPAPASPTTTTSPAPFDCRGSDDGLDEATKHAREAYCHPERDD